MWSGTNKRHFPFYDIQDLRKFIDSRIAKQSTQPGNWRGHRFSWLWVKSIFGKGAKLITPKQIAVFPFTLMAKKQWSSAEKKIQYPQYGYKPRHDQKQKCQGKQYVKTPFE
jgi:hypothetical protein